MNRFEISLRTVTTCAFVPLERIVNYHTCDVYIIFSWHLYQILRSVGYNHLSEYYASYLNTNYAAQLEAMGLWHWAVFVLMHIEDPVR